MCEDQFIEHLHTVAWEELCSAQVADSASAEVTNEIVADQLLRAKAFKIKCQQKSHTKRLALYRTMPFNPALPKGARNLNNGLLEVTAGPAPTLTKKCRG